MKIFHNDFGETALTRDEIRQKTLKGMDSEEKEELYVEYFTTEAAEDVVRWALKIPEFYTDFRSYFQMAEDYFVDGHCWAEDT